MSMATSTDNSRMTFEAVLFDCDGVLVDSEAITCGALRDKLDLSRVSGCDLVLAHL